jgi:hypothetical protein
MGRRVLEGTAFMAGLSVSGVQYSTVAALHRLGEQTAGAVDRVMESVGSGELTDFAAAVTALQQTKVQSQATMLVLRTLDQLGQEMLSRPRK